MMSTMIPFPCHPFPFVPRLPSSAWMKRLSALTSAHATRTRRSERNLRGGVKSWSWVIVRMRSVRTERSRVSLGLLRRGGSKQRTVNGTKEVRGDEPRVQGEDELRGELYAVRDHQRR